MTVGSEADLLIESVLLQDLTWIAGPVAGELVAQTSAHGIAHPCHVEGTTVVFSEPSRRVASGQSVVLYVDEEVVAGGIVA